MYAEDDDGESEIDNGKKEDLGFLERLSDWNSIVVFGFSKRVGEFLGLCSGNKALAKQKTVKGNILERNSQNESDGE